jgi:hypothetical protein
LLHFIPQSVPAIILMFFSYHPRSLGIIHLLIRLTLLLILFCLLCLHRCSCRILHQPLKNCRVHRTKLFCPSRLPLLLVQHQVSGRIRLSSSYQTRQQRQALARLLCRAPLCPIRRLHQLRVLLSRIRPQQRLLHSVRHRVPGRARLVSTKRPLRVCWCRSSCF